MDAELVDAGGAEQSLVVTDAAAPGGRREQTWRFPSRTQCMTCHNPWADVTLGFTPPQLDRAHDYNGIEDNQVRTLRHIGILPAAQKGNQPKALASPYEQGGPVEERARSYLHVNCSHCHRFGGGGTALIDLRYDIKLSETKTVGERPNQGTFNISDARIIDHGKPAHSVLLYRMAKLGHGRMPQIGSEIVDERAVRLVAEWIGQMRRPAQTPENPSIATVCDDPEGSPVAIAAIDRLLATANGALELLLALETRQLSDAVRREVIARGTAHPQPAVRDLFERFLPPERRIKRLGIEFKPDTLLSMKGDAKRGREVFFEFGGGLCKQCHQVNGEGENFGPDLSRIATKYDRAQLLDQILHPSKSIEPQYVTFLVKTANDDYTGFIVSRTEQELVLKDAQKREIRLRTNDVQKMLPQVLSTMPEGLLSGLAAQQAADLLEYLTTLK